MLNDEENPLHDIVPTVEYGELAEIDLSDFADVADETVADHIRSIASGASIGQLRQALAIPLDGHDQTREALVESFVARKMEAVSKMKALIKSLG